MSKIWTFEISHNMFSLDASPKALTKSTLKSMFTRQLTHTCNDGALLCPYKHQKQNN